MISDDGSVPLDFFKEGFTRQQLQLVGDHIVKRLSDEFGVELDAAWYQRVLSGEHDVPFPNRGGSFAESLTQRGLGLVVPFDWFERGVPYHFVQVSWDPLKFEAREGPIPSPPTVDARGVEGLVLTLLVWQMYRMASTRPGLTEEDQAVLKNARILLRSALRTMPEKLAEVGISKEED